jgi:integrase
MRYLTHDELHALANAAGGYRPLILTLGYCGLRWGEATALRVRDADLLGNRLSVERAYSDVAGTLLLGDTKTHAARQVGLPAFLRVELSPLMAGKGPDDLLFTTARGSALRSQNFTRDVLAHALRDAGVGRIRLHDLRHTAASLAIAAGANVKAVQRMLGHESATLTLDRYGHLYDGDLDALADRLNAAATDGRRDAAAVLLRSLPANG